MNSCKGENSGARSKQSCGSETKGIIYNIPACGEETEAPSDPREAGQAGSPKVAAGHMSSKMGGLVQIHLDRSKGLLPWKDLRSSSPGLSARSTSPHGCSMGGKEGAAGSGQKEADEG